MPLSALALFTGPVCLTCLYFWWLDDHFDNIFGTLNNPPSSYQSCLSTDGGCISHSQPGREINNDEVWFGPFIFLLLVITNNEINDGDTMGFGLGKVSLFLWWSQGVLWSDKGETLLVSPSTRREKETQTRLWYGVVHGEYIGSLGWTVQITLIWSNDPNINYLKFILQWGMIGWVSLG